MDGYEKLLMVMRGEANRAVDMPSYGLAEMTGSDSLNYNGLEFESDDILIAEHLKERYLTKLDFQIHAQSKYDTDDPRYEAHTWTDKSKYSEELKKGDTVFGMMVADDDDVKFIVLAKVEEL